MKLIKKHIWLFLLIFSSFCIYLAKSDYSESIGFFNTSFKTSSPTFVKLSFKNSTQLEDQKIRLYYSYGDNINGYSDERSLVSVVKDNRIEFEMYLDSVPQLLRIDFSRSVSLPITISQIEIESNKSTIDLKSNSFLGHPSILFDSRTFSISKSNLGVNYSPYLYLKKPIFIYKMKYLELGFIAVLVFFTSYFILWLLTRYFKLKNQQYDELLLVLALISLPFNNHWNSKVIIFVGLFLIYKIFKWKTLFNWKYIVPFLFYFSLSLLSLFWSVDIDRSLESLTRMLPLLVIPMWLGSISKSIKFKDIIYFISKVYALIAITLIFISYLRFQSSNNLNEFYYHVLVSPLNNANAIYIALIYLGVLLMSIYMIVYRKFSFIELLFILINFIFLILLSSKMVTVIAILTFLMLIVPVFKIKHGKKRSLVLVSVLLLSSTLLIYMSSSKLQKRFIEITNFNKITEVLNNDFFEQNYEWNGLTIRILQLKSFVNIEKDLGWQSLIGVGIGNGQKLLNKQYKKFNLNQGKNWEEQGGYLGYNFHNQYAQTLIEIGIIGFLFLGFIYFSIIKLAFKSKSRITWCFMLVFAMLMISESLLARQKGLVTFVFFPLLAIIISKKKS